METSILGANWIETPRLLLRTWKAQDWAPFAAMNADPEVMKFFLEPLTREASDEMVRSIQERLEKNGYGLWASELKQTGEFIGFVGLNSPGYPVPFAPCVEVGWRLARAQWGKGYAQEGARAALRFGFDQVGLQEIVSFTAVTNTRSTRVMERIGMTRDRSGDFDHPKLPEGHPLRRHVLYRIAREELRPQWQARLQGPTIELRPLVESDFEMLHQAASDPLIWEQHPEPNRYELERFRNYFRSGIESAGAHVILERSTGRIVGSSRFTSYDAGRSFVEIGYTFLTRDFWGGPTNRELKRLMIDHAFQFVEQVYFVIGKTNARSRAAIQKIGAREVTDLSQVNFGRDLGGSVVYRIQKGDSDARSFSPASSRTSSPAG